MGIENWGCDNTLCRGAGVWKSAVKPRLKSSDGPDNEPAGYSSV